MTNSVQNVRKKRDYTPYIILAPALLLICCIIIYPIFYAVFTSFQYYAMFDLANRRFVGLQNYIQVWHDDAFLASLPNTARWVIVTVSLQFLLGLILALILNQNFRFRGFLRSISLIPWVTPGVVIALMWMWMWMYNGNFGVLNDLLMRAGILGDKVAWLSNAHTALNAQILTMVWQGTPFFAIMILASLQSIPIDLYEAADVSGANVWQKFYYITWPHIFPTIVITSLLRIIWVFNNVEVLYLMTQGGPGYSSLTLSLNAYIEAQKSLNFGYGSTIAVYGTLIMILFMTFYLKFTRKNRER
ncbi:carbohydrate ABC transporter permease [Faecalispora jeddahensis]|uniref:carbohydrate ABC transporter permease n=1 Tax=Faecalispora jeddahensis TaxID=1414721 RepID=UPI00145AF626|nr:sugar ABC transporter permease [Faecalispora jeddahensis]